MNKYIYCCIFLFTSLEAQIAEEDLSGVYTEAVLFVIVFVLMSIVSYTISTRHAKEYAIENQKKIDADREAKKDETKSKEDRVEELLKMLEDGMITNDEFKMMKKRLYNTEE